MGLKNIKEVKEFVTEKENQLSVLYKNAQLSYWAAALSGKKEDYEKYEQAALEQQKFFHNKEDYETFKKLNKEKIDDEILARQIRLLYNAYLSCQGDWELIEEITKKGTKIEMQFNTFRAKVGGKELSDNETKEILQKELDNKKLQEVWEARKKQGALVEKQVLDLVKLRNKLAKSLGFRDYYEFSLEAGEQTEKEIEKIFLELEKLTDKPFRKLKKEMDSVLAKRYKIKEEELKPWHYGDFFFQEGPKIYEIDLDEYYCDNILEKVKKYYPSLRFKTEDILKRSDLYERKGKYQSAFCMDIDRKGDVRTLQNLKDNEYWMMVLLHELGHAIYSSNHDPSLSFILTDAAHIFTTEAIAILFERKIRNSEFIINYCNVKEDEKREIENLVPKILRSRNLVLSRWMQVMFHFERQLYKNPDQDLNKLWWQLVKKYQLLNFGRDKPDWASKSHLISSPVYYHNYMLGEMLASQIHNYITENITHNPGSDYSNNKEVGKYLIEKIFQPGARYRWDKFIELATGEPLTSKYFVEEFVR
jgi:peptidyl-dipeptidase A